MDIDSDQLLSSLLAKHSDDGERWNKIVEEYNKAAPEVKSKQWLKNRSKKLSSAIVELEKEVPIVSSRKQMKKQANLAANDSSRCAWQELSVVSSTTCKKGDQGCSFDEFAKLYHELIGDPRGCNVHKFHRKLRMFSSKEVREVMIWQKKGQAAVPRSGSAALVPCLKNQSYVDFIVKQHMPLHSQPATCGSLHDRPIAMALLCMERTERKQVGDTVLFRDILWVSDAETKSKFNADLATAFSNIIPNSVDIEKPDEAVLSVRSPKDCCVLSRIVLPSFIDLLLSRLDAPGSEHELIIVPYAKDQLYATLSSSPTGCFRVGELMDANNSDPPDGMMYIPFRIHSLDRSSPELTLLANGVSPVSWDVYSHFGARDYQGAEDQGAKCFPIPRSKGEASRACLLHAFSRLPSSKFEIHGIGNGWEDYISYRGLKPPFVRELTSMLTFPLTVLFAIRKFGLEFDAGSTIRIDIPGSAEREMQEGIWNELRNGLPSHNICLRLVGPNLEEAPAVHTENLQITSHRCLYEELLDESDFNPHLVVAFNAGVRDSWMPVIKRIIQKNLPMAITGYDIIDIGAGLVDVWKECDLRPQVIHDGLNPFGCALDFRFGEREGSSRELRFAESGPDMESGHPVIEHARKLLDVQTKLMQEEGHQAVEDKELFLSLAGFRGSSGTINKAWLLIRGHE